MVTYSRKVLWLPICVRVMPPFHFKSCVFRPMLAKGKNFVALAQRGVAVNDHVGMQPAMIAQRHVFADHAIRPDDAARANARLGMNHCRG
jgi:hypothetical protein